MTRFDVPMLARALKAASVDSRIAVRRASRLWSFPKKNRVALTDGHGGGNLGDDAVFEGALRLMEDCSVESYIGVSKERRLARLRLSGAAYFSHYVVGGGTIINHQAINLAKLALEQGLPAWTLGSGVGDAGFRKKPAMDLAEWRSLLVRFQALGVRGPRSRALLGSLGVDRAEVVGDLALALTPDAPWERASDPCFAVNVLSGPEDGSEPWIDEVNQAVGTVTRDAVERGWRPVFVALWSKDEVALRGVMSVAKQAHLPLHVAHSSQRFFELVGPCAFMISTRLHGAVLAASVGTQPLAVAYRDKVHDFMESMDLADYAVDVRDVETLRSLATELTRSKFDRRPAIWDRARTYRSTLERYVRTQLGAAGHVT